MTTLESLYGFTKEEKSALGISDVSLDEIKANRNVIAAVNTAFLPIAIYDEEIQMGDACTCYVSIGIEACQVS